jgi:CysZ protein
MPGCRPRVVLPPPPSYRLVMRSWLSPLALSLAQITDRAFIAVVLWSLACSAAIFMLLHVAVVWAVHGLLVLHGWRAWISDALATVGVSLLALWLFLPLAALIATLFIDRIAHAVERRHYPCLQPARGASLQAELADGLALAWRILLLNLIALGLALLLPGVGLVLAWAIGAYAIGRGLFMAVALRRHDRQGAETIYAKQRPIILAQGAVLAVAAYVPVVNLLVPVIGAAAMVHVLDAATQPRFNRM